jgi:hypothetical protein
LLLTCLLACLFLVLETYTVYDQIWIMFSERYFVLRLCNALPDCRSKFGSKYIMAERYFCWYCKDFYISVIWIPLRWRHFGETFRNLLYTDLLVILFASVTLFTCFLNRWWRQKETVSFNLLSNMRLRRVETLSSPFCLYLPHVWQV